MARLPLNIGLNPFVQQRRQILGERLLGANSGVDPSARSYVEPRFGITATSQGNMMARAGTETYGDIPFRVPYAKQPTPTVPMGLGGIQGLRQRQQQTLPQTPQSSMLAKIRSGLGASPTSPTGMALDSAAQSLLQQSGYSPVPRTTGQIFGEALGAAREGYMGGKALEQQAEQRAYEREKAEREFEYQKQQDQLNLFTEELKINKQMQDAMRARKIAEFGNEKDLRKEFDSQSKDFIEARIGLEKVLTAGLDPNPTGASDVALVFGYMKVLDPNSVVREGEFATAENTAGVSGKLRTIYNRALTGTRLTQPQRENFVNVSKNLFEGQLNMQKEKEQNFINLTNSYDLTPSQVVISKLPKLGSIINPHEIKDASEADDLPKGSYISLNGRLGIVE